MVGGDEGGAALAQHGRDHLADGRVDGLDGFHRGGHVAGVADHVRVGEVHDQHVGVMRVDRRRGRGRDLRRRHLGLHVVRRDLGAGNQDALLEVVGRLAAAVEEEGDVGVLLGLGGMELPHALVGEHRGQVVDELLGRVGHRQPEAVLVLGQADEAHQRGHAALETLELGVRDGLGDLAGPVRAEVEEDHAVAVFDAARGVEHHGHQELVVDALLVGAGDRLVRVVGRAALRVDHGAVGELGALPVLVAVHGVVAPRDRGDLAQADLPEHLLGAGEEAAGTPGRGVAAVEERMDIDPLDAALTGHAHEREHVLDRAVHAAVRDQPEEVEIFAGGLGVDHDLGEDFILEEAAVTDGHVDARELLVHDAPGAHVHVADLGVAHLPLGQAHREP
ncbi:hypothetical protein D3C72_1175740 [compost metagenome]